MPNDSHDQAEELLPWYATGQLDPVDRTLVETHLATCAPCRSKLSAERLLIDEFQSLSPEIDSGWARLRSRIEARERARFSIGGALAGFWHLLTRPAVATLATAQIAFLILAAAVLQTMSRPDYQALGAPQAAAAANVIVMFRPEAREADLRGALEASGASLVGGPTATDTYLLHVPADSRPSALAKLRADANVTLAQPIDGPAS